MKRFLFFCLFLAFLCTSIAFADDAKLRNAMAAGKTLVLTPMVLPGSEEGRMPISLSPDGRTVLWRENVRDLVLTRDGVTIPIHANPERGAGDPYGRLEWELAMLIPGFPGYEGVSWSPDGKYFICENRSTSLAARGIATDLILVDAENGDAFAVQSWNGGSRKQETQREAMQSEDFGMAVEARFDSTGAYIWFVGRIRALSETYSIFRYSMAENKTELMVEDIGVASTSRSLFEDVDDGWLIMADSDMGTSKETHNVVLRYSPAANMLSKVFGVGSPVVRYDRRILSRRVRTLLGVHSRITGYGLILTYSQLSSTASTFSAVDTIVQQQIGPQIYTKPRLNRITPEGVDLNRYWELTGDPEDLSSMHLEEVDPGLVDLMTRIGVDSLSAEERERLADYSQSLFYDPMPSPSCLCLSPGGHYAILSARTKPDRTAVFWLVDIETLALYPVKTLETLGSDYFGTALNRKFCSGIEWNVGDTLLIYNSYSGDVEAYRLEVK